MKLLYPPESSRAVRTRKSRRRRTVSAGVLAALSLGVGALYVWPGPSRGNGYENTDPRVSASLRAFQADYPVQRIDVRGRVWTYLRLGDAPEAVFFVHGMGGDYDIWWQQIRALMSDYTVLSIRYAAEPTLEGGTLALEAILDREGIDQAHLVGTSMGGYLAQYFVSRRPQRVSSLVMSNTFPPGDWIGDSYGTLARLLPILPAWAPQAFFRKTIEESIYPASGGSQLVREYLLEQSFQMSKADFRARLGLLLQPFQIPDVTSLGIPAIIIQADNDPSVPAEVRAELTRAYEGVPVITLNDVGHFPYLNRPAAYTGILRDFWAGIRVTHRSEGAG